MGLLEIEDLETAPNLKLLCPDQKSITPNSHQAMLFATPAISLLLISKRIPQNVSKNS